MFANSYYSFFIVNEVVKPTLKFRGSFSTPKIALECLPTHNFPLMLKRLVISVGVLLNFPLGSYVFSITHIGRKTKSLPSKIFKMSESPFSR